MRARRQKISNATFFNYLQPRTTLARAIPYIEFRTIILKQTKKYANQVYSTQQALTNLILHANLFYKNANHHYHCLVDWPYADSYKRINIAATLDGKLTFYVAEEEVLSIQCGASNEIIVECNHALKQASVTNVDIQDWVENFQYVLHAETIYFLQNAAIKAITPHASSHTEYHFNKEEFASFIQEYNQHHLTTRINHVILSHAKKSSASSYTFQFSWPTEFQQPHEFRATFAPMQRFNQAFSWIFSESELLNRFPEYKHYHVNTKQFYATFKIDELIRDKESKKLTALTVLNMWFSEDGLFGELRDIKKGQQANGNTVLDLYQFFDHLFRVKYMFICDASSLTINCNDQETFVPLRLMSALAYGKTWYETKLPGVSLFACKEFTLGGTGQITQDRAFYRQTLHALQTLSIVTLHALLKTADKPHLEALYQEYAAANLSVRLPRIQTATITLQDLVKFILQATRQNKSALNKLAQLTDLLCSGIDLHKANAMLNPNAPDYWLKSKVYALLWSGYIWVKKSADYQSAPASPAMIDETERLTLNKI